MGLFDAFKKKKQEPVIPTEEDRDLQMTEPEEEDAAGNAAAEDEVAVAEPEKMKDIAQQIKEMTEASGPVVIGVLDTDAVADSEDIMVIASLRGTVAEGDKIAISHPGTDTEILGEEVIADLAVEEGHVKKASNTNVVLRVRNGAKYGIRPGYVLHSSDVTPSDIHNAYIAALGDTFVSRRDLQVEEAEMEKLTLTDCAEIFRLYTWFHGKTMQTGTEEVRNRLRAKLQKFSEGMVRKLLEEPVLYCPYSKVTGAPYLFSRVAQQGTDYVCTPPNILVFTKAYHRNMVSHFDDDRFEVKEIVNDERGKEIAKFFRESICINGAAGVCILSEQTGVPANTVVSPEDMKATGEFATIANPELMRYIYLMNQIGKPSTPDEETIYKIYYRYLASAMKRARLIAPIKTAKPLQQAVKEGKIPLPKDTKVALATIQGKTSRPAVRLYTDRKHMRAAQIENGDYMLRTVASLISQFDCAINLTGDGKIGCYVNPEMFEDMKNYE